MSELVNAEVNSGNRIKSGTRIKLRYKNLWSPSVVSQQTTSNSLRFLCQKRKIYSMFYADLLVVFFEMIPCCSC